MLALCVKSCLRCESLARNVNSCGRSTLAVVPCSFFSFCKGARYVLLGSLVRNSCFCKGSLRRAEVLARRRGVLFQEASRQTRFVWDQMCFLQGRYAVDASCRVRPRRLDNRTSKAMAVVANSCLACDSLA